MKLQAILLGALFFGMGCHGTAIQYPTGSVNSTSCSVVGGPLVLGQTTITTNAGPNGGGAEIPSAQTMNAPSSVICINNRVFVADAGNNRVLVWNSVPKSNDQAADLVLGQASLVINSVNQGGAVSASTLSNPQGVASDGTRLFVADTGNNRILIWNVLPTTTGQAATGVVGQPDLVSSTAGTTGILLSSPVGVFSALNYFFVADTGNNRTLIWNTSNPLPTLSASVVLGQTSLTTGAANSPSAAGGMSGPTAIYFKNNSLYVSDTGNNRVLVWSSLPTANGASASFALGQTDLVSTASQSTSQTSLTAPGQISAGPTHFYISDTSSNRILGWLNAPIGFGQIPTLIFGEPDFFSFSGGTSGTTLTSATGIYSSNGGGLFIADTGNNRVLMTTAF